MKKHLFSLLSTFVIGIISIVNAQTNQGDWKTHYSYNADISMIANGGDKIFAVSDGKLFSYNKTTNQYETYWRKNYANLEIKKIAYNSNTQSLLVITADYNIDIIDNTGKYFNIPVLKNTNNSLDKFVNEVFIHNNNAYISTNFGLMVVDMDKKEIIETCVLGRAVYSTTVFNNKLLASTSNGVIDIPFGGKYFDINSWQSYTLSNKYTYPDYTFADNEVRTLAVYENKLHFIVPSRAVYTLQENMTIERVLQGSAPTVLINTYNKSLTAYNNSKIWRFTGGITTNLINVDLLKVVSEDNSTTNDIFWICRGNTNLSQIQKVATNNNFTTLNSGLKPNGPISNYPFFMAYTGNKIRVVGGAYSSNNFGYPGQLSEYGDDWFCYTPPTPSKDFVNVISDPEDPDHLFVASWGQGIHEYRNRVHVNLYHANNSSLEDIFPPGTSYTRINGLAFDKDSKLWAVNTWSYNILSRFDMPAISTDTCSTKGFYVKEASLKVDGNARALGIDKYNNKWIGAQGRPFMAIFNENEPNNPNDDKEVVFSKIYDQNGKGITFTHAYEFTSDINGDFWISTSSGLFFVKITKDLLDKGPQFNSISAIDKNSIAPNTLFETTSVISCKIDKANRKWVATEFLGVYLLSENAQDVIYHFTTDNSPLPSNNIFSLAIDSVKNIVYIGTDKGIVSFKDTPPSSLNKPSSVAISPNSAVYNTNTTIYIVGVSANSYIRITDEKGNSVNEGISTFNKYTWNLKDQKGRSIPIGIYYVYGSNIDGTQGLIGKIHVTN